MEAFSQTADKEELVIDTIEGLVDFFAYAQDAFQDFKESVAICSSEELCAPYVRQAEAAYEEIQSLVERHCKVLDLGGFLSEEDAEEIQNLYNKIITAQDDLEAAIQSPHTATAPDEENERETISSIYLEQDEDPESDYWEAHEAAMLTQTKGSLYITDETEVPMSGVTIRQVSIDSEGFRRSLSVVKGHAESLLSRSEAMLHEYQEMSESTEDDETFKGGVRLYQQLRATTDSIKNSTEAIAARLNVPVADDSELFLHHVTDELLEFDKSLTQIDAGLAIFFDEPESTLYGSVEESVHSDTSEVMSEPPFEAYRPNLFSKNEMRPAIEKVVGVPEYKKFLSEYFASPGAFEAYLRREINTREKISKFDSVFGIVRKSPFDTLLRDITLHDLEVFDHQPTEVVRHTLLQKDIQYEMYVDWMHMYEVMKELIEVTPSMTFGELYVRAMVEDLMDKQFAHAA